MATIRALLEAALAQQDKVRVSSIPAAVQEELREMAKGMTPPPTLRLPKEVISRLNPDLPAKKRINAKAKGTSAEHRCMEMLTKRGYACSRSAASLGAFDVVAVDDRGVLFIQVKSGVKPSVPLVERKAMLAVKMPDNCHRIIWLFFPKGKWLIFKLTEGDIKIPFLP